MARRGKDKSSSPRMSKKLQTKMDLLDIRMDDVYQNTYSSRQDNQKALNQIKDDIYATVDDILSRDGAVQSAPDISALYSRLRQKSSVPAVKDMDDSMIDITDIFTNRELMDSISANTEINQYLKSLDEQYDLICKYMPKLNMALKIKKDNVLSSDNFSKEFLNFQSLNMNSGSKEDIFNTRNDELKRIYKLNERFDEIYDETARYGEYFLYCVPYKKAIERLLNNHNRGTTNIGIRKESTVTLIESGVVVAGGGKPQKSVSDLFVKEKTTVRVTFCKGIVENIVDSYRQARELLNESSKDSLYESFVNEANKLTQTIPNELDYGKEFDDVANPGVQDGLINTTDKHIINDIPGCICKKLVHYNVKPWVVEDMCVGYMYFEFSRRESVATNSIVNSSSYPSSQSTMQGYDEKDEDMALKYLVQNIVNQMDDKFINTNEDLAKEIYIMLKCNDQFTLDQSTDIRITFLPPEDVFHFYFRLDPKTHHGISDLKESLVPAMFHCLLKLSTTVGQVTRGMDKRIYYVKQNVDTNVSRSLMNVINQVKKGNFGLRQMESMNSILNIVGRYNDHVVPVGPNGDSPIQFEVLEGQRIETPTELLEAWEEEAVGNLEVPIEFINTAMQVDYAMRFTMSNTKFLRMVYKRQTITQEKFSDIYTRIYNYHYGETESRITVTLPAPSFLSMTNGAQLVSNTRDYVQQIADLEYIEDTPEKQEFIRGMMKDMLASIVNITQINKHMEEAEITVAAMPSEEEA